MEILFLLKLFYYISLSLFHLFPFLFIVFMFLLFFLVYVCFMFLFFLFLFCLSSFFIYLYVFIYLFSFYFLFQKDSSFFYYIYFYLDASLKFALQEDHPDCCCGLPAGPVGGCLPWPPCRAVSCPCPCPVCHHRQTDRQIDTTIVFIYKIVCFSFLF